MITCTILSFLVIAAYTAAVCVKQKGIPYSMSSTYYKLSHPYWFMVVMWGTALLLMPAVLESSREGTEWAAFLALAGLMLVGATPKCREEYEGKIHNAGAIESVAMSQLWVILNQPLVLYVWMAWAIYTITYMARHMTDDVESDFKRTRPLFWVEMVALVAVYLTVIINI